MGDYKTFGYVNTFSYCSYLQAKFGGKFIAIVKSFGEEDSG